MRNENTGENHDVDFGKDGITLVLAKHPKNVTLKNVHMPSHGTCATEFEITHIYSIISVAFADSRQTIFRPS